VLGCYDFCGHYEWTFAWLDKQGGHALVREYWDKAIRQDSQRHASDLIIPGGIDGMKKYWGHTLDHEAAGYTLTATDHVLRIDMHQCPSKGFLLRNHLAQHPDYCDHCMGWIGPLMKKAGFVIDHEHNHCGQCWWEMRRREDATPPSDPGALSEQNDVRLSPEWSASNSTDVYSRATDCDDKESPDTSA